MYFCNLYGKIVVLRERNSGSLKEYEPYAQVVQIFAISSSHKKKKLCVERIVAHLKRVNWAGSYFVKLYNILEISPLSLIFPPNDACRLSRR